MISTGQRLVGFAALLAVLALVVGVPYALWQLGGPPWPESAPTTDWFTQPLESNAVMGILTAVLWLAWLHFCLCVVVELVNARRGARHHVPGGAVGTASLARRLVAATLLLVGSATATIPAASALSSEAAPSTVTMAGGTSARGADGQVSAGSTARQVQHSASPRALVRTGDELVCTVQPPSGRHYDSLWALAERYLGEGRRWGEIYELNRGVLQDDGQMLKDPDLIYPGWQLVLPADAKGPGIQKLADVERDRDQKPLDGGDVQRSALRGDPGANQVFDDLGGVPQDSGDLAAQLGVAGGFVAAALLLALRRRRGWHGGPGGPGGGLDPDEEAGLRLAADAPGALVVDRGLRSLHEQLAATGKPFPTVHTARLDPSALVLELIEPVTYAPPDGWAVSAEGRRWTAARADLERLEPAADTAAPCPALVTLGQDGADVVLLNLGAAPGIVALDGDRAARDGIARSLAVELATNRWSDGGLVTLVGFGADLSAVVPERIRQVASIEDLLARQRDDQRPGAHVVVLAVPPTAEQERALTTAVTDGPALGLLALGNMPGAAWRLSVAGDGRLTNRLLGLDLDGQRLSEAGFDRITAMFAAAEGDATTGVPAVDLPDVPALDPRLLEATSAPVEVRLFGPAAVQAPGSIDPDRVEIGTEIIAYLALHPEGVHPSVLRSAIWPRGVSDEVADATLRHVQAWLGTSADGSPRLRRNGSGRWVLDLAEVRVDWHVLRVRAGRPETANDAVLELAAGLAVVRGPVMETPPAHRYAWLARSTLLRDMQVTVVSVALDLAARASAAGQRDLASQALRTGLACVPACEELWQAELRLSADSNDRPATARIADEMYAAIARHGSPRGATAPTDALVDDLLPGYRRTTAPQVA